jgi:Competence-damaged protein
MTPSHDNLHKVKPKTRKLKLQTSSSFHLESNSLITALPGTMASPNAFPPPELQRAAEEVAALLRERGETIAVAETAAGGLISAALLSTPGASAFYRGGLTVST